MAEQSGDPRVVEIKPEDVRKFLRNLARAVFFGFVLILVLAILASGFFTVQPSERGVVKRFGQIVRTTDPGLHLKLPLGIEEVQIVPTERIQKAEFGFRTISSDGRRSDYSGGNFQDESLMLTGDLNVIDVQWVVQYQVSDPEKFLYRGLQDPVSTLRDVSESVMQRVIGNRLGSNALTVGRIEVAELAQDELQRILDGFDSGIRIIRVEMQDVTPPDLVKPSFNEVNEARQERERMINEAERRRNEVIPRAAGEARKLIAESEGYALERVNRATGEATRFLSIVEEYRKTPDVTRQRLYLEMIEKVLPRIGALYVMEEGQIPPLPLLQLGQPAPTPTTTEGRQ